ncbi:hypothetical protein NDU88_008121 [Pleurodeles waltl]|uniref:CCHC-type domain-containing protein n=1 Tax=Pleurodeles waltl TaxID=8319 RepID=A0AAV7RRE3_PLEWA|nr:hypothetical protein NDU88_008121 [Pleurodeles waltl]
MKRTVEGLSRLPVAVLLSGFLYTVRINAYYTLLAAIFFPTKLAMSDPNEEPEFNNKENNNKENKVDMVSGNAWNLTAPETFMPKNGEPTLKWEEWREYFENYISTFEDEDELTPEKKKKILLHCLDAKGLKTYNSINKKIRAQDQGDVFSHALEDLTKYFKPTVCVAVDRFKFYHRKQQLEELVEDYVAALKNLALSCKFWNLHDDLIRDQLIMHTANPYIQEKLWARGEALLQEVIEMVKSAELTGRCAKAVLRSEDKTFSKLEDNVTIAMAKKRNKSSNKVGCPTRREKENLNLKDKRTCFRCGSKFHLANDRKCPARNQKCSSCSVLGHFAKVCCRRKLGGSDTYVKCVKECDLDNKVRQRS